MTFYISNGLGDSEELPSERTMRHYLDATDATDDEHGAAWVADDTGNALEFNRDGTLVLTLAGADASRHMVNVSKERTLELWLILASGRIDQLHREPWNSGSRPPLAPEQVARRKREMDAWQLQQDRSFCDLLGPEEPNASCQQPGCPRQRISHSVLCRRHHFENIRGRPYPFSD